MRSLLPALAISGALNGTAQQVGTEEWNLIPHAPANAISSVRWFGIEEGLPDRKVTSLAEDGRGFIWMATQQGLVRFDGRTFENHTRDQGLLQDAVHRVAQDRDGLLWIMFMDSTIQLMDPLTRRPLALQDHFGDRMPQDCRGPYSSFQVSDDGLIVLGQNGHLVWYGGTAQGFRRHPNTEKGLVEVLRVEKSGDLWCNVGSGSASPPSFALVRVSFTGGWNSGEVPACSTLVRGIWHTGTGIDHYGPDAGGPEGIYFGTFHIEGWAAPDGTVTRIPIKGSNFLLDAEARMHTPLGDDLWVVNARIRRMAPGDDPRLAEVEVDMHGMYSQAGHAVRAVLRDRSGRIWVGTDFGVLLIELLPARFQRWFCRKEMIHGFGTRTRGMALLDERLFVNTENDGYLITHARSGALLQLGGQPQPRLAVLPADSAHIWDCGSEELVLRRIHDGYAVRKVIPATVTWSGHKMADGTILLGTSAGFYRLGKASKTERVDQPLIPEARLPPVWHIAPVADGLLACTGSGLYLLDTTGLAIARYWSGAPDPAYRLPADDIRHLYVDPAGIYWLATATRGLVRWDRRTGASRIYGASIGMPQAAIHAVYPDSSERLWMPTDNGLVRLQPENERIEVFTTRDGITHNEFNRISHIRGPDGTLYLGGLNGITVFHPDRVQARGHHSEAPLVLKSVYVQPADGERIDHTEAVLQGLEMVMRPRDRYIALDMVLLCYDEPALVRYAWRVDLIDAEWNIQREPNLRITTLPYGHHTIRLRGIDHEGRWSEELAIPIRVIRPVHLRWWFIIGMIILIALAIYLGVRYRIRQLRRVISVRDRIAMDLHDEVGSNLSGIVLFSSAVAGHREKLPAEAAAMLDRISQSSTRAIEEMNDIVWSVNTMHDQLADVLDRMQVHAQPLCDAAGIHLHFDVPEALQLRKVGMEQRRALYMVFKEAINNAVKHAACSRISVRLRTVGACLELVVEDDGRGIDTVAVPASSLGGHGFSNLRRRAHEAGGTITITSAGAAGTRIVLRVPLRG